MTSFFLREQVAGRGGVIHRGVSSGAEHVVARLLLEHARRSAVEVDGQRLQLIGDRRHREATSRRDVADHRIDLIALHEVAKLSDHLRGRARLVDELGLDLGAAEAHRVVRRRRLTGVERLDHDLGAVTARHAERAGRGTREERDDAELDRRGGLLGRRGRDLRHQQASGGRNTPVKTLHNPSPQPAFAVFDMP